MTWTPWHFIVVAVAGWMNRRQQEVIEYPREENRILREKLGGKPGPAPAEANLVRKLVLQMAEQNGHGLPSSREAEQVSFPSSTERIRRLVMATRWTCRPR
jgi:hypothetical protein